MTSSNHPEIQQLAITKADFSRDFCLRSRRMGFSTLQDILEADPQELTRLADFTHLWLAELSDFLEQRQALHLLQPGPGNNAG